MIQFSIPGRGEFSIKYLILDFNGTLASGGKLNDKMKDILNELSKKLDIHIHVFSSDTFGTVKEELSDVNCKISIIKSEDLENQKLTYLKELGTDSSICIGNGLSDKSMLAEAALGICVVNGEGASPKTIIASDVVTNNIYDALELVLSPKRLISTLRN
jgi:soluble P-type ATPase